MCTHTHALRTFGYIEMAFHWLRSFFRIILIILPKSHLIPKPIWFLYSFNLQPRGRLPRTNRNTIILVMGSFSRASPHPQRQTRSFQTRSSSVLSGNRLWEVSPIRSHLSKEECHCASAVHVLITVIYSSFKQTHFLAPYRIKFSTAHHVYLAFPLISFSFK